MTRDYYCTGIPGARVEALLVEHDRLALIYTDAHCVQWREDVVKWDDVSPEEWAEFVDDDGIKPDGIETMLDGMTREDLLSPLTG